MLADFLIRVFNRAATGNPWARVVLTPLGPVFFLGFLTLLVVISLFLDEKLGFDRFLPPFVRIPIVAFLFVSGTFLATWSICRFFIARGTPVPFNPPPVLVRTGPYARSRNPMLTGVFLILFGIGVFMESVFITFVFTPLFILIMIWELKKVEEPELLRRFGGDYIRYREKVPMFFPGIRKKTRIHRRRTDGL